MAAHVMAGTETGAAGRAPGSLAQWVQWVNAQNRPLEVHESSPAGAWPPRAAAAGEAQLLTADAASGGDGFHLDTDVAQTLLSAGLDPDYLGDLATASGLQARDLFEFAGIDRTTVGRRKASGAVLPHDAAVKALQATELLGQAIATFGAPAPAALWLTKAHPLLEGDTPLRRARTPWGLAKVQGLLVALRYGSAA